MKEKTTDYGMLVTVTAAKDSYLFVDGIDMDRYMATLIKMFDGKKVYDDSSNEVVPLSAGMKSETAQIVFRGGDEELLRRIMRSVHISYSAYRKNKKLPVKFGKSTYDIIEGITKLKETQKIIRQNSSFICCIK